MLALNREGHCEIEMKKIKRAYSTKQGTAYWCKVEEFLESDVAESLQGKVQLIMTSPPFPLNKKKAYGNLNGKEYKDWVVRVMRSLVDLLTPKGSLVVEIGNSWVSRSPEMSTLPLETLLAIKEEANLHLCQQFIVHNPARLPSPVQWVNKERSRVKDTFTNVWWLSPNTKPNADNRRVLQEYSPSMKKLLDRGSYNSGGRPSGHKIGTTSFLSDNGGAIPPNVIQASNTCSSGPYVERCQELGVAIHPARMQQEVPEFFVKFLTKKGDLVLDPFMGSNVTGEVCELSARAWIGLDTELDYLRGSTGRFEKCRWWLRSDPIERERSQ